MKTKKTNVILLLLGAAILLFAAGCDEEQATNQEDTITNIFGDLSVTVTGYMTNTQWAGVPNKIKTAIEADGEAWKPQFSYAFNSVDTIEIVNNPSYNNYSTVVNGSTIHINAAILNNANALKTALQNASAVVNGVPGIPTTAKLITPARDTVRLAKAPARDTTKIQIFTTNRS